MVGIKHYIALSASHWFWEPLAWRGCTSGIGMTRISIYARLIPIFALPKIGASIKYPQGSAYERSRRVVKEERTIQKDSRYELRIPWKHRPRSPSRKQHRRPWRRPSQGPRKCRWCRMLWACCNQWLHTPQASSSSPSPSHTSPKWYQMGLAFASKVGCIQQRTQSSNMLEWSRLIYEAEILEEPSVYVTRHRCSFDKGNCRL